MDLNELWKDLQRKANLLNNSPANKQSWDNPILSAEASAHCQQQIEKLRELITNPPVTVGFLIEYGDPTKPAGIMTRMRIRLLFNFGQFKWQFKEVNGLGVEGSGVYFTATTDGNEQLLEWATKMLRNYHRITPVSDRMKPNFETAQFFLITEDMLNNMSEREQNRLLGFDDNQLEIV